MCVTLCTKYSSLGNTIKLTFYSRRQLLAPDITLNHNRQCCILESHIDLIEASVFRQSHMAGGMNYTAQRVCGFPSTCSTILGNGFCRYPADWRGYDRIFDA